MALDNQGAPGQDARTHELLLEQAQADAPGDAPGDVPGYAPGHALGDAPADVSAGQSEAGQSEAGQSEAGQSEEWRLFYEAIRAHVLSLQEEQ